MKILVITFLLVAAGLFVAPFKSSSALGLCFVGTGPMPLTASCSVSPTTIYPGDAATWIGTASGGDGSYAYSWLGTDGLNGTASLGSASFVTKIYTTAGTKTASLTVTSGSRTETASCSNALSVAEPTAYPSPLPDSIDTSAIADGALIQSWNSPDVWIVKYIGNKKFKRLILNPAVFNSYGHLRWDRIQNVSQEILDAFAASDLVRASGDTRVYRLLPQGDTGERRWITTTETFAKMNFDWDAVYEINNADRDSYQEGDAI